MDIERRLAFASAVALAGATLVPTLAEAAPHHPAIDAAINALQSAKADLVAAAHDFGGHRAEAIAACDNALRQLRAAIIWANRHDE